MVISNSVPVPPNADPARIIESPELIDRMAAELRARSDTDLPHSFYVEQIRRQLAGQAIAAQAVANDDPMQTKRAGQAHPSVFHAWALSD
ncbi:hypothetical protein [Rhizobium sp. FY34]|uniref:hypothetical protein n=1 Tax=Rhizobium sp. FY34 TaxID=2562309 RepID=UPI0010C0E263|nr:hypothetical protein [Rhizobium sp. FY34]